MRGVDWGTKPIFVRGGLGFGLDLGRPKWFPNLSGQDKDSPPVWEPCLSAPLPAPDADAELDAAGLLWRFGGGVMVLIVSFAVLGAVVREPLEQLASVWVAHTGLVGMFLAIGILDAIPTPIPPDLFTGFAAIGGLPFWTVTLVASAASVAGGSSAWLVARLFRTTDWFHRFIHGRGRRPYALVKRFGTVALVLGAVSPLPFSLTCYAAGALGMPYGRFVSVALLRAPRILFYLALIRFGWVGVGGV